MIPDGPGWGADVNEEAVRARTRRSTGAGSGPTFGMESGDEPGDACGPDAVRLPIAATSAAEDDAPVRATVHVTGDRCRCPDNSLKISTMCCEKVIPR